MTASTTNINLGLDKIFVPTFDGAPPVTHNGDKEGYMRVYDPDETARLKPYDEICEYQSSLRKEEEIDIQRFSVIDIDDPVDKMTLATVKTKLFREKWGDWLIDQCWNRAILSVFGLRNNKQRRLNKARDLLVKPPKKITTAINRIAEFNLIIKAHGGIPITVDNAADYVQWIRAGQVSMKGENGEARLQTITNLPQFVQTTWRTFIEQLILFGEGSQQDSPFMVAATSTTEWIDAMRIVGKFYTDAEYRALVTIAQQNIIAADGDALLVAELTLPAWAEITGKGQTTFIAEVAIEFSESVKEVVDEKVTDDALKTLLDKVKTRAQKIAELTKSNKEVITNQLLKHLNDCSAFKDAFMQIQDTLITVVQNNQSLPFLAKQKLEEIQVKQQEIIEFEKYFRASYARLKGEAAIVASIVSLHRPEATRILFLHARFNDLVLKTESLSERKPSAVDMFRSLDDALFELLINNNHLNIQQGEKRAERALYQLLLLNDFVSNTNASQEIIQGSKRPWCVNASVNHPLTKEQEQNQYNDSGLQEGLLTMIEQLAGQEDSEGYPTLLYHLYNCLKQSDALRHIDHRLTQIQTDKMFSPIVLDNIPVIHTKTFAHDKTYTLAMLQFAEKSPSPEKEKQRQIAELRQVIRKIREEQAERQRQYAEEKIKEQARLAEASAFKSPPFFE